MGSLPISVLGAGTTGSGGETRSPRFRRIAYEDGRIPSILNPSKERNRLTPSLKERCGGNRVNSPLYFSGGGRGAGQTAAHAARRAQSMAAAGAPTHPTASA